MPTLDKLANMIIQCTLCPLHEKRNNPVPGEGSEHARIMLIGEGPGFHEDQSGKPFVGAAGNLLNDLLAMINLKRNDVFITNMVKCRPPDNRDPSPEEIATCSTYLDHQISLLQPTVIMTLGRHALTKFFPNELISKVRGKLRQLPNGYKILPSYHPAAVLRNSHLRPIIEQDFKTLAKVASQTNPMEYNPGPKQLSMFS